MPVFNTSLDLLEGLLKLPEPDGTLEVKSEQYLLLKTEDANSGGEAKTIKIVL